MLLFYHSERLTWAKYRYIMAFRLVLAGVSIMITECYMVYHNWGDEGVDWKGISDAAYYIGGFLRRYGRVQVTDMKEKYGSSRIYCHFGWSCLLNITHPGWAYYRPYPKWLMRLDIHYLSRVTPYLNRIIVPYHKWLYRLAYKKALKKWSHLELEILCGADWQELLGGLSEKFDNLRSEDGPS